MGSYCFASPIEEREAGREAERMVFSLCETPVSYQNERKTSDQWMGKIRTADTLKKTEALFHF